MGRNRLFFLPCTVLLATCSGSPSAPTEMPDVRGSWKGVPYSWNWTDNYSLDPGSKGAANCAGTVVITSQDGSSFAGRYAIEECSEGSSGAVLDGHVGANGQLSFRLLAETGWGPGLFPYWDKTDCRVSEDSGFYEGWLSKDTITVQRLQILTCSSAAGRAVVTATFQGARQ